MKYIIKKEELTPDDVGYLTEMHGSPLHETLKKLITNRMDTRKEDLVNCKWFDHRSNRARIEELSDLLNELDNYSPEVR
jgi:hypothetical protein